MWDFISHKHNQHCLAILSSIVAHTWKRKLRLISSLHTKQNSLLKFVFSDIKETITSPLLCLKNMSCRSRTRATKSFMLCAGDLSTPKCSECLVRLSASTTITSTLQFGSTACSATNLSQTSILSVLERPRTTMSPWWASQWKEWIWISMFQLCASSITLTYLNKASIDAIVQVFIIFLAIECRTLLSPKYLPGWQPTSCGE